MGSTVLHSYRNHLASPAERIRINKAGCYPQGKKEGTITDASGYKDTKKKALGDVN